MNQGIERFAAYLSASHKPLEQTSKEEIAEVARVLTLHVGHYIVRYGDVSICESMELLQAGQITDETTATVASGLEELVKVLKAL